MPLRQVVVSGIRWSSLSQYGQQGLLMAATAMLSRLLSPADFGLLSMALVVTRLPIMFKDLGTRSGIIQHEGPSDGLLSSVFWLNVIFGLAVSLLIWASAPLAAGFYGEPALTPLLRALSSILLFWGPRSLLQALLERELMFSAVVRAEMVGAVAGTLAALTLGYNGCGVWSLAALHIVSPAVTSVLIWRACRWRPSLILRWSDLRGLVRYSGSLTAFNILNFLARNADYVIIGRVLGAEALGYYTLAYTIMLFPLKSVSGVIGRGVLPAFARMRNEPDLFKQEFLKISGLTAAVSFPMMMALMALCEPLISAVLGVKWLPAVPIILILAPVGMAHSILTFNGLIYQATGRTDRQLLLELVLTPLIIISCIIGLRWGIGGVAWAYTGVSLALIVPSAFYAYELIGLSIGEMARELSRPLAAAVILFAVLTGLRAVVPELGSHGLLLAVALPAGAAVYFWSARRLLVPEFERLQHILRP